MVIPAHALYYYIIIILKEENIDNFLPVYLLAAVLQVRLHFFNQINYLTIQNFDHLFQTQNLFLKVYILLLFARFIVYWLWSHRIDPDNWAIPAISAIGDLLGTGLLACALYITLYFKQTIK
jgi:cation transporter-like permease